MRGKGKKKKGVDQRVAAACEACAAVMTGNGCGRAAGEGGGREAEAEGR